MNEFAQIVIKCKVALVVCIIDDYTSKTILSRNINVFLEGVQQKPINKNGHYVFINIEDSVYTLRINSKHYFDEVIKVDTGMLNNYDSVLYVRLKPKPNYPFDAGAGLLRMKLQDSRGEQVKAAQIHAVVISKENYKAKVVQEKVKKGDDKVSLICTGGQLTHGETLFVADEEKSEYCMIDAYENYEEGIVKLHQPLKYEHQQGTLLMPAVSTFTDDRGEAIVYFKYFAVKIFEVQIKLKYEGKSVLKNVTVEEGKSLYLGLYRLH